MSKPTWADFVRWVADCRGLNDGLPNAQAYHAAHAVQTREGALCVFAALWFDTETIFDDWLRRFTAIHGAPVGPPSSTRAVLLEMAAELEEQAARYAEGAKVFPLVDGVPPVCRVQDEARSDGYSLAASQLRDRIAKLADPAAVPRERLLALAEELVKEADEADSNAVPGDGPAALGYIEGKADALHAAESRLRAILGEAQTDPCLAASDHAATPLDGYEIVGECPVKPYGKWRIQDPSSCWIPRSVVEKYPEEFDLDPRGNPLGSDDGSRWCLNTRSGAVQLREGDRVVVLRPISGGNVPAALPKPKRVEPGQRWRQPADCVLHVVEIGGHHTGAPWAEFDACDCEEMLSSPDWIYLGPSTGPATGQQ